METTSHATIVVVKLSSSIIFCIDGQLSVVGSSNVLTNQADSTHILDDLDNLTDQRFVHVGCSGDAKLLKDLRETLQVEHISREDFTPTKLAMKIRPLVEGRIRKKEVYYGIVFAGIGEGKKLEVVYLETTAWGQNEKRPWEQKDFKAKLTVKEIDHYYATGTGVKWLDEFFKSRYGGATGQVNIPMDMPLDDAKKLVLEGLTYASDRDVGVGGLLHGFILNKVDEDDVDFKSKYGDFKFSPFDSKYRDDFDLDELE